MENSFIDLCVSGEVCADSIDEYVGKWSRSNTNLELHEYLGMTGYEYDLWLRDAKAINTIISTRKMGIMLCDRKYVYDQQIKPLLEQVTKICSDNQIAYAFHFALKTLNRDGEHLMAMVCNTMDSPEIKHTTAAMCQVHDTPISVESPEERHKRWMEDK